VENEEENKNKKTKTDASGTPRKEKCAKTLASSAVGVVTSVPPGSLSFRPESTQLKKEKT